jgi:DNA repair exonuclease SbcCD nuclease subunit
MKIAITADLHLNPDHSERSCALITILEDMKNEGIGELIIAGDLFDRDGDDRAYAQFLDPCRSFPEIRIHLIPGNHDSEQSLKDLSLNNLQKYCEPTWVDFNDVRILFVPYKKGIGMGEMIHEENEIADIKPWALVGHGDFIDGLRIPNPREKGVYMPLRKSDLESRGLKKVFLGHIHKPTPIDQPLGGKVIYAGSPQGLDVSETGYRRYLIFETTNCEVSEKRMCSGIIYLDLRFFVFPSENEIEILEKQLEEKLGDKSFNREKERIEFRFRVEGFSGDKDALVDSFTRKINSLNLNLYKSSSGRVNPDFDNLLNASDPQRNLVAQKTIQKIDQILNSDENNSWNQLQAGASDLSVDCVPVHEEIKMAALRTIYQIK